MLAAFARARNFLRRQGSSLPSAGKCTKVNTRRAKRLFAGHRNIKRHSGQRNPEATWAFPQPPTSRDAKPWPVRSARNLGTSAKRSLSCRTDPAKLSACSKNYSASAGRLNIGKNRVWSRSYPITIDVGLHSASAATQAGNTRSCSRLTHGPPSAAAMPAREQAVVAE